MSRADTAVNIFLGDPEHFADVINHGIFRGQPVIIPDRLVELDTASRKRESISKVRDIIKSYQNNQAVFILIGIENQTTIHYAMPLRIMDYDSRSYEKQRRAISARHHKAKDLVGNSDEYISGFSKSDRLIPVITLVVYYGNKAWDGATDLHGILDIPDELRPFKDWIGNYKMHLLEVARINDEDLDSYSDDLKCVFGFIKYQKDKQALRDFIYKNEKLFSNVPVETCEAIQEATHLNEIEKYIEKEQEGVNMCVAIQEMIEDGRTEGEVRKLIEQTCKKLRKRQTAETIADALEEDPAYIQSIVEAAQKYAPDYDLDLIFQDFVK
ncbi:Rpn family recombination-promoting nuclease/putative transposase [Hespellia stercorisuis]|uniref:Putative transposase, YhgA-like n=1 Tax=Hespellia stercorisuis DSM 15480 TaxID=1121950 RepID=A0A1M6K7Y6_9FIRM|nr:Rpn family recombination-promoting nuclease/putative transposase [Hespellia stercorisuis]SHJ55065.1 Putative transposase, YhgA-like [Hespellia stercorisuis DSM 15480]